MAEEEVGNCLMTTMKTINGIFCLAIVQGTGSEASVMDGIRVEVIAS